MVNKNLYMILLVILEKHLHAKKEQANSKLSIVKSSIRVQTKQNNKQSQDGAVYSVALNQALHQNKVLAEAVLAAAVNKNG